MSKKRLNAQHEIARWEAERSLVEMELAYFRKQSADTEARGIDPSHWINKIYERELRRNRAVVQIKWYQGVIDKIDAKAEKPGFFGRYWYEFFILAVALMLVAAFFP
ncbi:hypothetical protein Bhz55_00092 [Stenotrophomonas phage vB_SmaS_Bhz55]